MIEKSFRKRPGQDSVKESHMKAIFGPEDHCVCPQCGFRKPREENKRCMDIRCPQCGTEMANE